MMYWYGFLTGAGVFIPIALKIANNLYKRRFVQLEQGIVADVLETQREISVSGRTDEVPVNAGPAGEEFNLFEMHPGTVALAQIQDSKSLLNQLDFDQDSSSMDVGSKSDRES